MKLENTTLAAPSTDVHADRNNARVNTFLNGLKAPLHLLSALVGGGNVVIMPSSVGTGVIICATGPKHQNEVFVPVEGPKEFTVKRVREWSNTPSQIAPEEVSRAILNAAQKNALPVEPWEELSFSPTLSRASFSAKLRKIRPE